MPIYTNKVMHKLDSKPTIYANSMVVEKLKAINYIGCSKNQSNKLFFIFQWIRALIPKEKGKTIKVFINDPIKDKEEGFMQFSNEFEKKIAVPFQLAVNLRMVNPPKENPSNKLQNAQFSPHFLQCLCS
jgi:hypothetical protein